MRLALLLIALGAAACVSHVATYGSNASAGHPPPLAVGAAVPMWDHFWGVPVGPPDALIKLLDEASANGWELVGIGSDSTTTNLMCFKRPRPGAPAERPVTRPPGTPPAAPPQP